MKTKGKRKGGKRCRTAIANDKCSMLNGKWRTLIEHRASSIFYLLLALLALALCAPPAAHAQSTMKQFSVVNTSTTVPKQLTNAPRTMAISFTIEAKASAQGGANVSTVYIGPSSTDGANGFSLSPGSFYSYTDPKGREIDLSTLYIDVVSANDGVTVYYW